MFSTAIPNDGWLHAKIHCLTTRLTLLHVFHCSTLGCFLVSVKNCFWLLHFVSVSSVYWKIASSNTDCWVVKRNILIFRNCIFIILIGIANAGKLISRNIQHRSKIHFAFHTRLKSCWMRIRSWKLNQENKLFWLSIKLFSTHGLYCKAGFFIQILALPWPLRGIPYCPEISVYW